jgi:hypothetical protein
MAAARLFAECGRELIRIHERSPWAARLRSISRAGDGKRPHHKESRSAGVEGADGTSPTALRPSAVAITRPSLSAT